MTTKQYNQLRTKFSSYSSGEFLSLFINKLISNMSLSLLDQAKMGNLESEGTYQPLETELYKNCIECISLASSNDLSTLVGLLRRLPSPSLNEASADPLFWGADFAPLGMAYDKKGVLIEDTIPDGSNKSEDASFLSVIAKMSEGHTKDTNDLGTREYAEAKRPLPTPVSNASATLPSAVENDGDPMLGYEYEESEMYERDRG